LQHARAKSHTRDTELFESQSVSCYLYTSADEGGPPMQTRLQIDCLRRGCPRIDCLWSSTVADTRRRNRRPETRRHLVGIANDFQRRLERIDYSNQNACTMAVLVPAFGSHFLHSLPWQERDGSPNTFARNGAELEPRRGGLDFIGATWRPRHGHGYGWS
jgi:hypothetical protein